MDINRHVNKHRPLPSRIGNVESLLHDAGDILRFFHKITIFYKGFHRACNIRFLKHIATQKLAVYLTRNTDQRYTVGKSGSNARDHIGRTGTGGNRTYSRPAGHSCHTACRMSRILLGTDQYRAYLRIQYTVIKRADSHAGITENHLYAFFF